MKNLSLILVTAIALIQPAFAYENITSNIKYALKHSTEGSYFSVVIALGIVILLIYITGIIYAKLNVFGHNTMKKQYLDLSDSKLIILSTTPIGNNKSLMVVELAGKKMLIGVTNEMITLIKDLDDNKTPKDSAKTFLNETIKNEPLDKIYPKDNNEDIEIKNNVPKEGDSNMYNSEEFGLYKKYLDE